MLKKHAKYQIQILIDGEWHTVLFTNDYWWEIIITSLKETYFQDNYRVLFENKTVIYIHEPILKEA